MLKCFKDKYSEGRSPIDTGLLAKILREAISLSGEQVNEDTCKSAVTMFIAGLNYYLYLHPEQYIDFGKFVAYRGVDLSNLLTIEAKDEENAKSIYEYYKNGGLQKELIQNIINRYASELIVNSLADEEAAGKDIEKLRSLTSHTETENYNYNKKEKENGI